MGSFQEVFTSKNFPVPDFFYDMLLVFLVCAWPGAAALYHHTSEGRLIDINGDGLIDKVIVIDKEQRVFLNTGCVVFC